MPEAQAPILKKKLKRFSKPQKRWDGLWGIIYTLYYNMAFSGHPDLAREILSTFIASLPQGKFYNPHYNHPILSIWTHLPSSKPTNLPSNWPSDPLHLDPASKVPERDLFHPDFHTFFSMCGPSHRTPLAPSDIINLDTIDPHSWSTSTNPRHVAACARVLCRVPPRGVPTRAALDEAFNAMERIWDLLLPQERDPATGLPRLIYDEVFPASVYLSFAVGLGHTDKATLLFQRLSDGWGFQTDGAGYFHVWAELYELCLRDGGWLNLIAREDAEACVEMAREALTPAGPADPNPPPPASPIPPPEADDTLLQELMDLRWRDLLRRFSEAAFTVHRGQYRELENPPKKAEDILLPPISPAVLAEVEEKLGGPLPADIRGMVVVANGFRGLWHPFGGGFPGVDKFGEEPCDEWWLSFGGGQLGEPSDEAKRAPVWVAYEGAEESDDFNHIICPTETWRKLVGEELYVAGEYRVTYTSHWDGGYEAHKSVREWIATETMQMEQMIAKGSWEGKDSDDEDDDDDEDEDEEEEDEETDDEEEDDE